MKKLLLVVVALSGFLQAQDCSLLSSKIDTGKGTYNVVNKDVSTFISTDNHVISLLLASKDTEANHLNMQFTVERKNNKINSVYSFDKIYFLMQDSTKDFILTNQVGMNLNGKTGAFFGKDHGKIDKLNLLRTMKIQFISLDMGGQEIHIRLTEKQGLELMQAINCAVKK